MDSSVPKTIQFPFHLTSLSGLSFQLNENGSIRRIDHADIMLNLFLGNEADGGLATIYLRKLGTTIESIPLFGPNSPASYNFTEAGMTATGTWGDLRFRVHLVLAEKSPAWFWHVEIENSGETLIDCDLILTQDLGLAHYGAIRLNEFYVSQYIDHTSLSHPIHGTIVASRQNQAMGGNWPWTLIGSLTDGVSHSTDVLQFQHLAARSGTPAPALTSGLPGERLQHEHSLVSIQDAAFTLAPGGKSQRGFFGLFEVSHPLASSTKDIGKIDQLLQFPEALFPTVLTPSSSIHSPLNLYATAPLLHTLDLSNAELHIYFGANWQHAEIEKDQLLSFFTNDGSHVVLKAKESKVLRPHGHIIRSGGTLTPDETALTSTTWMSGVFHSMVTQGHVSINRFLSTCHTYLGLFRSHGQRIFIEVNGKWFLLGTPSAFEIKLDSCRWIYKHAAGIIEIISSAPEDRHELKLSISIIEGPAARFLISHHIALNGDDGSTIGPANYKIEGENIFVSAVPDSDVGRRFPQGGFLITPEQEGSIETIGGDELLYLDGITRQQPFLCFITAPTLTAALKIEGKLIEAEVTHLPNFWKTIGAGLTIEAPAAAPLAQAARGMAEIFPWFIHNALVHYLSPRGLEQYSGGGWGTRDVCQGPVELLLALGRFDPIRDLICRVFRHQNADGDWPQWFMFFERERGIRPDDSHGDIVYWPLLALAQYLTATRDSSLLEEVIPFFHPDGDAAAEHCTILKHVERALKLIEGRVITGTHLAAYGHGDWNDSLQPAKPEMRERLCSSWTVTLNYQTYIALANAFRGLGDHGRFGQFQDRAIKILEEFQHLLIVDGIVAGLAFFHENGKTEYLLHPKDATTGLSYSLLPMIHAVINDMFTPAQAESHLELIRNNLLGPDGARLFDRPMRYQGGMQINFQRAESAAYFGREIGIMYTHAHLRYAEALAHYGDADGFFHALCQMNPIGIREFIASAGLRQANCYYSSSDAAFPDRYKAYQEYDKVKQGEITLEGGWRIYSSGAGIFTRLIMQCFLGLRLEKDALLIDPTIPISLSGLKVSVTIRNKPLQIRYEVVTRGSGPLDVSLNGAALGFTRESNPYRSGAIRIMLNDVDQKVAVNNLMVIRIQ